FWVHRRAARGPLRHRAGARLGGRDVRSWAGRRCGGHSPGVLLLRPRAGGGHGDAVFGRTPDGDLRRERHVRHRRGGSRAPAGDRGAGRAVRGRLRRHRARPGQHAAADHRASADRRYRPQCGGHGGEPGARGVAGDQTGGAGHASGGARVHGAAAGLRRSPPGPHPPNATEGTGESIQYVRGAAIGRERGGWHYVPMSAVIVVAAGVVLLNLYALTLVVLRAPVYRTRLYRPMVWNIVLSIAPSVVLAIVMTGLVLVTLVGSPVLLWA